jgi:hypothetical protein
MVFESLIHCNFEISDDFFWDVRYQIGSRAIQHGFKRSPLDGTAWWGEVLIRYRSKFTKSDTEKTFARQDSVQATLSPFSNNFDEFCCLQMPTYFFLFIGVVPTFNHSISSWTKSCRKADTKSNRMSSFLLSQRHQPKAHVRRLRGSGRTRTRPIHREGNNLDVRRPTAEANTFRWLVGVNIAVRKMDTGVIPGRVSSSISRFTSFVDHRAPRLHWSFAERYRSLTSYTVSPFIKGCVAGTVQSPPPWESGMAMRPRFGLQTKASQASPCTAWTPNAHPVIGHCGLRRFQ